MKKKLYKTGALPLSYGGNLFFFLKEKTLTKKEKCSLISFWTEQAFFFSKEKGGSELRRQIVFLLMICLVRYCFYFRSLLCCR